ncbi:MAG: hypothetical protein KDK08_23310 [Rhizobiaceae bacterium]|nr:hypothetical protein [Rhizobiaceae bacterium]
MASILAKKYTENPFVKDGTFVVPTRMKSSGVIETAGPLVLADTNTGEVMHAAEIRKRIEVDSDRFVKLFVAHLDAFFDLKPGTIRLMTALIDELSQARYAHGDSIYLNYNKVREYFVRKEASPPAKATFFSAMAELTEKGFVAPSVDTNLWFINPAVFFNGDRVRFVTELKRKRQTAEKRRQELEAAGQEPLALETPQEPQEGS